MKNTARGFTLIELVVTIAIVSILAMAVVPLGELGVQRNKEHELRSALWTIRAALDAYKNAAEQGRVARKADGSGYPPDLRDLVKGVPDAMSPNGERIYFLRRLPRDPFHAEAADPAELTWGLRAYASPPDQPAEGDDVFDVYSRSKDKGLNGIAYRDW